MKARDILNKWLKDNDAQALWQNVNPVGQLTTRYYIKPMYWIIVIDYQNALGSFDVFMQHRDDTGVVNDLIEILDKELVHRSRLFKNANKP